VFNKRLFSSILLLCVFPIALHALGEPPDFSDQEEEPTYIKMMNKMAIPEREKEDAAVSENVLGQNDDEAIFDQRKKVAQFLKLKQFPQAKNALEKIPTPSLKTEEISLLGKLMLFDSIDKEEAENQKMFKRSSSLDPETERTVKRLYRGAQSTFLEDEMDLTKDLLIQTLHYDRRNFKAKKLLERGLNLGVGAYKVENIETKYWKLSLVNLYSGYPEKSVRNLEVLEYFDPENPMVFERMGSAYYSMGEPKKAIQSWKRALYLDPTNKNLAKFIKNAEKEVDRQNKMAKEMSTKTKKKKKTTSSDQEMQLLRVVTDANTAYSYAQEVRTQLKGVEVVVEEMDNGKWAVKIPKQSTNAK
jgi:tetratricopeptide (TPR) repeat protein